MEEFTQMLTVVLPRTHPDLDGVACAVAYAEFLDRSGTPSRPWIPTEGDTEAEFVLKKCSGISMAEQAQFRPDTRFILVDASGLEGFPDVVPIPQVVEVIDHRQHGDPCRLFPNANIYIEAVGAAATVITEKYVKAQIIPSESSGKLLYGAIHSNTQELKGGITTDRDVVAAAWLEAVVTIPPGFLDEQFMSRRNHIINDLEGSIARESKTFSHPTGSYVIAQLEFRGAGEISIRESDRLVKALARLDPRAMLNMVDLKNGSSYLLVPNPQLREVVAKAMHSECVGIIFESKPSTLRKQIVAALESNRG
jgi:nanoRNase/pAp phosphatase (c-di-AMP/oligoRNAs hydrolase)